MLKPLGLAVTLIARANLYDGYQLPPATFIDNVSPVINDQGTVAFRLLSFLDGQSGIVFVREGAASELAYAAGTEFYLTDPSLSNSGQIYFSEYSESGPTGLFRYDQESKLTKIFGVDELFDFSSVGTPAATSDGFCVRTTKGADARSVRDLYCAKGEDFTKVFGEGQVVAGKEKVSYVFTPGFNLKGDMAVKLRLGARGEFSEERPDVIALIEGRKVHVVASDMNADPASKFVSFHNTVTLNESGEVALVGDQVSGRSCLVVASKTKVDVRVCEGEAGIGEIEMFTIQLNDEGSVAFRAIDESGKRNIYLQKRGETLPRALIAEGDSVPTDLGEDRIVFRNNFPGFSGNIGLNNRNAVVFHAVLETSGAGIFVIRPSE